MSVGVMRMIDYEKIGRRIYEERKFIRRISQEKMAEDLGMYQADISNLEKAKKSSGITDLNKLQIIADYFSLPIENLLFGSSAEAHMVNYEGSKMELRILERSKQKIKNTKQKTILQKLLDTDPTKALSFTFECGPYTTYIFVEDLTELQGVDDNGNMITKALPRWHCYTFFNDMCIANMLVDQASVFQLVNFKEAAWLQKMIQFDVLDTVDAQRTLNPYIILRQYADNKGDEKRNEDLMFERMDALRPVWGKFVFFVESIYVMEDCRQHGICRMLLDILHKAGDPVIWINMEPTSGAELSNERGYIPSYTQTEISQLTLNAVIAEKLGITVDPDTWHRQEEVIDPNGNKHLETVLIRKCAYYIPKDVWEIIKDDGDLVAIGRAKQKVYKSQHDELGAPEALDIYTNNRKNGQRMISMKQKTDNHGIVYIFAVKLPEDEHMWFGVSKQNPVKEGIDIDMIERWDYLDDAEASPFMDTYLMLAMYISGFDEYPEEKDEL